MQKTKVILRNLTALIFFSYTTANITEADAASFDCTKAGTAIEKQICADPLLSKLDDALGYNYSRMNRADIGEGAKKELKVKQMNWLKARNKCQTKKCIEDAYINRLDAICEYPVISGAHPTCILSAEFKSKNQKVTSSTSNVVNLICQPKYLRVVSKSGTEVLRQDNPPTAHLMNLRLQDGVLYAAAPKTPEIQVAINGAVYKSQEQTKHNGEEGTVFTYEKDRFVKGNRTINLISLEVSQARSVVLMTESTFIDSAPNILIQVSYCSFS